MFALGSSSSGILIVSMSSQYGASMVMLTTKSMWCLRKFARVMPPTPVKNRWLVTRVMAEKTGSNKMDTSSGGLSSCWLSAGEPLSLSKAPAEAATCLAVSGEVAAEGGNRWFRCGGAGSGGGGLLIGFSFCSADIYVKLDSLDVAAELTAADDRPWAAFEVDTVVKIAVGILNGDGFELVPLGKDRELSCWGD